MLQNFLNEQPITGRTMDDVSYVNFKKNLFTVVHQLILRLRVTIFNVMITVEIAVIFTAKLKGENCNQFFFQKVFCVCFSDYKLKAI